MRRVKRVIMCSGKVYYDLIKHRETKKLDDVAIIRVEVHVLYLTRTHGCTVI
jgi:2-oxoglutarate dehydrogenase complex dehydrogenase (E1) component-like enzyme